MKTASIYERIKSLGQTVDTRQGVITVIEVGHLWDHLVARYDVQELTQVMENYADDLDLKAIFKRGRLRLDDQIKDLENLMGTYGISLPGRPPAKTNSTLDPDVMPDRYLFRNLFRGVQEFLDIHVNAFEHCTTSHVREFFLKMLMEELEMFDQLVEYGKLKGWVQEPPKYREK